jgi:hypothetical protein
MENVKPDIAITIIRIDGDIDSARAGLCRYVLAGEVTDIEFNGHEVRIYNALQSPSLSYSEILEKTRRILDALDRGSAHSLKFSLDDKKLANHSLSKLPGAILLTTVDFLFSPITVEKTFKPLVADWRYEYFEALKQGRTYKAHWISIRYRCAFVWAMSLSKVFSLLKQLKSISK